MCFVISASNSIEINGTVQIRKCIESESRIHVPYAGNVEKLHSSFAYNVTIYLRAQYIFLREKGNN